MGAQAGDTKSYTDVEVELTRLIFRQLIPTLVLATTGVAGTLGVLAHRFHDTTLWCFACAVFLLSPR